MSLQVNFTTHGHDLKAAYEAILRPSDPKNGDNWAIFGYDKGTNDLKVLGQGNGGLEELQEEFMDGKIQYAFTRIVDPYSQLNKFVLIAWCGDGVPESKKGLFNSHLTDVAKFLKGYHLQINARCDADVTPAQIMKRAQEGSGSKYSTHQENYQQERIQPLQSAYKRTEIPDIAALQRNPTKPEPAPKFNIGGSKPLVSTPSTKIQGRVWPPPASSSSPSNVNSSPTSNPPAERSWKTSVGTSSYSASSTTASFNKVQPPSSLSSFGQSSPEPVVNKAHQIRLEREAREKEERERIKREIAASESREKQSGTSSTAQRLAEERRLQEEREREREKEKEREQEVPRNEGFNRVREERLAREKEERERAEAEDSARAAREAARAREETGVREQASAREEELRRQKEQDQKRERESKEAEARRAQEQEGQKKRQQEDEARRRQDEEEDRRRQDEEEDRRRQEEEEEENRLNHQQQQEEEERQRQYEHEQREAEEHERRLQEEVSAATAQSVALGADAILASADHPELSSSDSVSAIVLYSYEKAEENEMSLVEGEVIRNVTELDVGWWSGESEDGTRSGLFPANYVEVIEHSHAHEPAAPAAYEEEQHYDQSEEHALEHHAPAEHDDAAHDQRPSAVALYDYVAGEPNEISFAEGEAIVEIEFVTDDWWSGKTEGGATGLFPANYVELIAH